TWTSRRSRWTWSRTASTTCSTFRCRCRTGAPPRRRESRRERMGNRGASAAPTVDVLRLRDISTDSVSALLQRYGVRLERVADGAPIPGSYWGEPEAGLVGSTVHARGDTPVHSLLHEAAHLIVLPPARRAAVHTDATDSIEEEDAVC